MTAARGRPKKDPEMVRDRAVRAKLNTPESKVFDELRKKLGGEIEADESRAVRLALREAAEKRGLTWPSETSPAPAAAAVAPPAPPAAERAPRVRKR